MKSKPIKYGWWSDMLFKRMPAVVLEKLWDNLHKKLSISVPFLTENLVGCVILGIKPFETIALKYSLNIGFSFIFNRSILKSPAIIASPLVFWKSSRMGMNSSIKV